MWGKRSRGRFQAPMFPITFLPRLVGRNVGVAVHRKKPDAALGRRSIEKSGKVTVPAPCPAPVTYGPRPARSRDRAYGMTFLRPPGRSLYTRRSVTIFAVVRS